VGVVEGGIMEEANTTTKPGQDIPPPPPIDRHRDQHATQ